MRENQTWLRKRNGFQRGTSLRYVSLFPSTFRRISVLGGCNVERLKPDTGVRREQGSRICSV